MPRLGETDLARAATKILMMLLAVDENEGLSLKHLRLIQLCKRCEDRGEPCTSARFVEETGWPPSTVSRLVADLMAIGHDRHPPFFETTENPNNRREKIIVSTPAAAECREQVIASLRDAMTPKARKSAA